MTKSKSRLANPPRNHHYNPACYLKQWAGVDGQLSQYMLVQPGKIATKRKHPNATGFEIDLYKTEGLPGERAQVFETAFMKWVDDEADLALQKLVRGDGVAWNVRERSALSRFILSLRYRHPEGVRELREHMLDVYDAVIDGTQDHYQENRSPNDPPTLAEYLESNRPEMAHTPPMRLLMETIDNEKAGTFINDMPWTRLSLQSAVPLLTSDRPLDMPFGLDNPKCYIALPVSPQILFVAGCNDALAYACKTHSPEELVTFLNQATVAKARKFVWGIDDKQLAFVNEWMGKEPDRPLLSEEQKKAALDATRQENLDARSRSPRDRFTAIWLWTEMWTKFRGF